MARTPSGSASSSTSNVGGVVDGRDALRVVAGAEQEVEVGRLLAEEGEVLGPHLGLDPHRPRPEHALAGRGRRRLVASAASFTVGGLPSSRKRRVAVVPCASATPFTVRAMRALISDRTVASRVRTCRPSSRGRR